MRCHDVIRELAVPTAAGDSAAIEEHLAGCAACKAWAERARGLDTLWHATRPSEPAPQTWDAMWTSLVTSLDVAVPKAFESAASSRLTHEFPAPSRSQHDRSNSSRSRSRTLGVIGLVGLAQAAAVLLAVGLTRNGSDPSRPPQVTVGTDRAPAISQRESPAAAVPSAVEIDEGQLVVVVIRNQGKSSTVVNRTPVVTFLEVDDWYLMFSAMESESQTKVVMKD
jgi:hypothetical protein